MSLQLPRMISLSCRCLLTSTLRITSQNPPLFQLASASSRYVTTTDAKPRNNYVSLSRITPPPTKTTDELASGAYLVRRTPSTQLPIYKQLKSGGTRVVVLIKKVEGDRRQLLEDLITSLKLGQDQIRINPVTQNLELKGDHYDKAKSWLLAQGF